MVNLIFVSLVIQEQEQQAYCNRQDQLPGGLNGQLALNIRFNHAVILAACGREQEAEVECDTRILR